MLKILQKNYSNIIHDIRQRFLTQCIHIRMYINIIILCNCNIKIITNDPVSYS